ncbi:hypothetical protein MUY35_11315 [Aliiroseovarius sp. S1339]|uniref:hypothetical protein n=1 Tax=Aliiroseovarius sp. S1339 TaxID=2936990 RepID=UPI0020BDF368|nr:hypothetical protein [Aliiroseovarius sp. S1339]MCK8464443.1 hypothetical protein [Aliiroseovarius sp. S1339]
MLISCSLIALATSQPAQAVSYDTLLNTPALDPCNQFTDDAEMVVLYLDMSLEGREVEISLPQVYLEDRLDQQSGMRHGSLLFRMMIGNALPVSREQTRRLTATHHPDTDGIAPVTLLIGDFADLDEVAANLTGIVAVQGENAIASVPYNFGLTRLSKVDRGTSGRVFTAMDANGSLTAVLECGAAQGQFNQTCTHYMRAQSIDVVMDYPARLLSRWSGIQVQIERFLRCATGGS